MGDPAACIPRVGGLGLEKKEAQVPCCCKHPHVRQGEGRSWEERQLVLQQKSSQPYICHLGVSLNVSVSQHVGGGGRDTGQRKHREKMDEGHKHRAYSCKMH